MKFIAGLVGLIILIGFVGPGFIAILLVFWLATALLHHSAND